MSIDNIFEGEKSDEKTFFAEISRSKVDVDLIDSYEREFKGRNVVYTRKERDGYNIWCLYTKHGRVECRVPHKPFKDFLDVEDYEMSN